MRTVSILCLFTAHAVLPAQTPPVSVLEVQAENVVIYTLDTTDILGWGIGQPFPEGDLLEVNSPVEVTVNGKRAEVINKIGWPAMTNV